MRPQFIICYGVPVARALVEAASRTPFLLNSLFLYALASFYYRSRIYDAVRRNRSPRIILMCFALSYDSLLFRPPSPTGCVNWFSWRISLFSPLLCILVSFSAFSSPPHGMCPGGLFSSAVGRAPVFCRISPATVSLTFAFSDLFSA